MGPVCQPGEYVADDGTRTAAGLDPNRVCEPGELETPDGCVPAGVPEDACGVGFVHDGDGGCMPVLPSERCAFGTMAIPGESACRAVGDCGAGSWGDIPVGADTQFVDASFQGTSDGSEAAPWTRINDAHAAADAGAIVAVAAGRYVE